MILIECEFIHQPFFNRGTINSTANARSVMMARRVVGTEGALFGREREIVDEIAGARVSVHSRLRHSIHQTS